MTGQSGAHTNRPELVAVHGYDTKFAMHALRLGVQGTELLTTGRITLPVPEPDLSYLRQIRRGEIGLDEVVDRIDRAAARLTMGDVIHTQRRARLGVLVVIAAPVHIAVSRCRLNDHPSWLAFSLVALANSVVLLADRGARTPHDVGQNGAERRRLGGVRAHGQHVGSRLGSPARRYPSITDTESLSSLVT